MALHFSGIPIVQPLRESTLSNWSLYPICRNVSQIIAENSANSGDVFGLVPGTVEAYIHTYRM